MLSQFLYSNTPIAISAAIAAITRPIGLERKPITAPSAVKTTIPAFTNAKTVRNAPPSVRRILPNVSNAARCSETNLPAVDITVWIVSLTRFSPFMIVSRTSLESIPSFSKSAPITESFPCMKLIKSSTIRTTAVIASAIPISFRFFGSKIPPRTFFTPIRPFTILLKLNASQMAPAAINSNFIAFSTPPILSTSRPRTDPTLDIQSAILSSHLMAFVSAPVTTGWALFNTRMKLLKALIISLPTV